jgi:hypothetical protein
MAFQPAAVATDLGRILAGLSGASTEAHNAGGRLNRWDLLAPRRAVAGAPRAARVALRAVALPDHLRRRRVDNKSALLSTASVRRRKLDTIWLWSHPGSATQEGGAVILRRNLVKGLVVFYPAEPEIAAFFAKLPPEIAEELEPQIESGRRAYRRARQTEPANEQGHIRALCEVADHVFIARVAKLLRVRAGDYEAFCQAIGLDGGEAETAFWCAHRVYNIVDRGRMLAIWHKQIESHIWDLIREAEGLWDCPDLVPERWRRSFAAIDAQTAGQVDAPKRPELSQDPAEEHAALIRKLEEHIRKGKTGIPGYHRSKRAFVKRIKIDPADYYRWERGEKPRAASYPERIEQAIKALKR